MLRSSSVPGIALDGRFDYGIQLGCEAIWGGRIMGAKMRAETARQEARKAARAADRAEADRAWSIRMEGYGAPAQA
jgi:hypothetical protein